MDICITQLGTFGDMILATPIIKVLKHLYPQSKIHFIAGKRNHIVIKYHPLVNKIYVWDKNPIKLTQVLVSLKLKHFDYYIDPKDHFSRESLFLSKIVNAKVKIGLNSSHRKNFHITIPDESQNTNLHFTQRVFQAFKELQINVPADEEIPKPDLYYSDTSKHNLLDFLGKNNLSANQYLVFNISASHPRKTFTQETLKEIFTKCYFPIPVVLCFDKKDKNLAKKLQKLFPTIKLLFSRDILDVFAFVEHSRAAITPDTSIVHIATAYNKPTLAFYSGLNNFFKKFHPNNSNAIVVRARPGDFGIHSIPISSIISSINHFSQQIKVVL
ncbi:lipopolysaccharide heptosyltransferase family protein [Bacteroidetes/Chlorobi group bacterium MS-B_bin-24]|jgi:ADP-heptose:LPS heptosyltransferase|nr:MAG: lipopolysaccharide heptosyltransferase family protein [Bacteroidetes/Chlorobi group bacterium MS-B_bin-24]